jgi:hypothetical protein
MLNLYGGLLVTVVNRAKGFSQFGVFQDLNGLGSAISEALNTNALPMNG